ncbi:unnamed protein product, partial [Phaeothamnion confervicola]
MKIVVLQPSYLPWLGHLDQYCWSDRFVLYDDVQYDKHGWRNRNRILTANGIQWITVPVKVKGQELPLIKDVEIDEVTGWRKKQLESIRQAYSKAPYFDFLFPELEKTLETPHKFLIDLDIDGLQRLTRLLGQPWKGVLSSELGIPGRKTERLVGICRALNATDYLTGDAAREYLDESQFESVGVRVHWHGYAHPVYRHRGKEFVPYLSVIDLMFWHGPESASILRR